MKRTPVSQPSADLDEMAVRGYLKWKPVPNPCDVFDQEGNILYAVKNSPEYKGLADALRGRSCFSASSLFPGSDSEAFRYTIGYSEGKKYLESTSLETRPSTSAAQGIQLSLPFF